MAIASGFAYGRNFPPDHPELAGVPLTYPFFCDLIAGMVLTLGGSWRDAFFWPTLILGLSVVVAVVRFGQAVTGSRALGRAAAGLTFFSGGLGFLTLTDFQSLTRWWTGGPDLTINDAGVRYANVITTLFIPQRAILFGWPLLFFALALLIEGLKEDPPQDGRPSRTQPWLRRRDPGLLAPPRSLPLLRGVVFLRPVLRHPGRTQGARRLRAGVLPLALPAVLFMASHNSLSTGKFLSWQPGFDGGDSQPIRYWAMNGGLFFPLAALGIARASRASVRALSRRALRDPLCSRESVPAVPVDLGQHEVHGPRPCRSRPLRGPQPWPCSGNTAEPGRPWPPRLRSSRLSPAPWMSRKSLCRAANSRSSIEPTWPSRRK